MIGKNEYRLRISRFRKIRSFFPILIIGFLTIYIAFIAPFIAGLFVDDFLGFFLSQAAIAMVPILLFTIFFYLMIVPITYTLQGIQAGQIEIFLSAPVKPSDVLLGEFLGVMPFYAIFIVLIAGLFTASLAPLGLSLLEIFIIVLVFCIISLCALWIGTVIAAFVRTRFAKSARGKDIGRALSLVLGLPIIAIMYAIVGGGLTEALSNPGTSELTRSILSFLPSSWGADIILDFASNPSSFAVNSYGVLIKIFGLVFFFIGALWVGTKLAGKVYSIEPTSFTASKVKPDGSFYKSIRFLGGGGSFGTLLTSVFKDYIRRLENLSKLIYILGLMALVNIFLIEGSSVPEDSLIIGVFLFAFLAVLIVGQITFGGKEGVFLHKKSPSGIDRFTKARLIQSWLIAIPIGVGVTVISLLLLPQIDFISLIGHSALMGLLIAGNVVLALGFAMLRPEFSENAREQMIGVMINAQIVLFISIGIFIGAQVIFNLNFVYAVLVQSAIIWLLGLIVYQIGKSKIKNIE